MNWLQKFNGAQYATHILLHLTYGRHTNEVAHQQSDWSHDSWHSRDKTMWGELWAGTLQQIDKRAQVLRWNLSRSRWCHSFYKRVLAVPSFCYQVVVENSHTVFVRCMYHCYYSRTLNKFFSSSTASIFFRIQLFSAKLVIIIVTCHFSN